MFKPLKSSAFLSSLVKSFVEMISEPFKMVPPNTKISMPWDTYEQAGTMPNRSMSSLFTDIEAMASARATVWNSTSQPSSSK